MTTAIILAATVSSVSEVVAPKLRRLPWMYSVTSPGMASVAPVFSTTMVEEAAMGVTPCAIAMQSIGRPRSALALAPRHIASNIEPSPKRAMASDSVDTVVMVLSGRLPAVSLWPTSRRRRGMPRRPRMARRKSSLFATKGTR
ncbi:hypothetical protein D3C86_645320 [compost metagenome]